MHPSLNIRPRWFASGGFSMNSYRNRQGKLLRCGYTTGSCAAAGAKAAVLMLLGGAPVERVCIETPRGIPLELDILRIQRDSEGVSCAVRKDSGDDPDVTNGMLVYTRVKKTGRGIRIDGGEGVGRVEKPGLNQPVGAAAINDGPRRMIQNEVRKVFAAYHYEGGVSVTLSIPGGAETAKRTFNPRMGITGGLSILGTSGILEPMSSAALTDSIRLELKVLRESGTDAVLLVPGNYGEDFARQHLGLSPKALISCSNYLGAAMDGAVELGFQKILLVGHIGKLVKLGIGVTNTHSTNGDGRMETLVACALEAGGSLSLLTEILACVTTDAALNCLQQANLLDPTMEILSRRIGATLTRRIPSDRQIGYVCFTNGENLPGILSKSENADALMALWRK